MGDDRTRDSRRVLHGQCVVDPLEFHQGCAPPTSSLSIRPCAGALTARSPCTISTRSDPAVHPSSVELAGAAVVAAGLSAG